MLGVEQGFFMADLTAVSVSCLGWSRDPLELTFSCECLILGVEQGSFRAEFTAVRVTCLVWSRDSSGQTLHL